jgi:hypothetical protein
MLTVVVQVLDRQRHDPFSCSSLCSCRFLCSVTYQILARTCSPGRITYAVHVKAHRWAREQRGVDAVCIALVMRMSGG